MFLVAGCDLIAIDEAQETLETAREIQRIQDEEIRPRLAALEDFQQNETEPREQQIETLSRQSRVVYREKIEPLEEQLRNLYPDVDRQR